MNETEFQRVYNDVLERSQHGARTKMTAEQMRAEDEDVRSKMEKRVNLPLCESDGKWYGSCLGDNCDIAVEIQHDAKFPMAGRYTFTIRQDMRVNPLENIKSVGLRVEKTAPPKAQN